MSGRVGAAGRIALCLALCAADAEAVITQVNVTPANAAVPLGQPGSVTLTWQATSTPVVGSGGGAGSLVTSPQGVFRADGPTGPIIGASNLMLQMTAQGPPRGAGIAALSEVVTVPLGVLQQAERLGAARIVYQRVFNDGTAQPPGSGNVGNSTFTLLVSIAVDVNPPVVNIAANQTSSIVLTWRLVSNDVSGVAVGSAQGVFRAGGPNGRMIGTNQQPLQGRTRPAGATSAVSLTETVQIPAQTVLRAQQLGVGRISYQRVFEAAGTQPAAGNAVLGLTGGLAGTFGLSRIALRFVDGGREATVAPGSETFVYADVTHTGTGRLEGRWEVAEPGSTRGVPVFRSLSLVRRPLIGSGAGTTFRSPPLPTDSEGVYLVRLSVSEPAAGFEPPVLRYVVNPGLSPPIVQVLMTISPEAGVVYGGGVRFAWLPAADAASYRLEFHDSVAGRAAAPQPAYVDGAATAEPPEEDRAPLSGIVVPAAVNETELSPLALSHLAAGRAYWWRIVAFDGRGRMVARSALRRLHIPAQDDSS